MCDDTFLNKCFLAVGGDQNITYACKIIIIVMATVLSSREQNKKATDVSVL